MRLPRISIATAICLACLLVACVTLVAITAISSGVFRRVYEERIIAGLASQTRMLVQTVRPHLRAQEYQTLTGRCRAMTSAGDVRVTIVLPDGRVVADSEHEPADMDNHADRKEVFDAVNSGAGQAVRHSGTLGHDMYYYALPVFEDGELLGVARVALRVDQVRAVIRRIQRGILAGAAGVALFTLLVSLALAWAIYRPMRVMTEGVRRFAQGDFSGALNAPRISEMAALADSLNAMAAQLDERLRAVTKERNQQEAVLSSMVEGVLAVDTQGRVMTHNQAASRLTGIDFAGAQQQLLRDIAPNTPLSQFVGQILNSAKPKESEFGNLSQRGRILQVHGSVLRDAQGKGIGAVVVLNDVTRLRRLEQVRRDFVANVSHELRTPITSIKGFVETLLDGALDSPEDARRFLDIVAKQSDRLNAIVGDLLTLSGIEEGEEKGSMSLEVMGVRDILEAAIQLCSKKASAKEIRFQMDCPGDVVARINPSLFEQAVSNLVDNAVKYSPAGSDVVVRAEQGSEVVVSVEDRGCGIAPEHLPRLFERFYRVDKARSRALGGTGLGLSIVNHIITAHGGRVTVESVPGAGSTFSIYLPGV